MDTNDDSQETERAAHIRRQVEALRLQEAARDVARAIVERCPAGAADRRARRLRHRFDQHLALHELNTPQFQALAQAAALSPRGRPSAIADRLELDRSSARRLLARLTERGLLAPRGVGTGCTTYELTPAGVELLLELDQTWADAVARSARLDERGDPLGEHWCRIQRGQWSADPLASG